MAGTVLSPIDAVKKKGAGAPHKRRPLAWRSSWGGFAL